MNQLPSWKASLAAPSSPHRGFYADDDTCKHCSSSCRTCEGNATNCQSCERGLVLDQGVCRKTCPESHVAMGGVCKRCPEMCQDCIHEKTCKGTWEPHRGEGGGPLPESGMSNKIWGNHLHAFTETDLNGGHQENWGWHKAFPWWILQIKTDKSPFFIRFLPHTCPGQLGCDKHCPKC